MARKSKRVDAEITHWMEEIKAGEKYRDTYSKAKEFQDYRKYYRGDWNENLTPVNRVFSFGRSLVPKVYFHSPRVVCTPTRPDLTAHAMVMEAVDNYLIQELKLKKVLKRAILHAYLGGTAPVKLGYDSEFGYTPLQAVDDDSATMTQVSRLKNDQGRFIEYNVGVRPGMPWAMTVMPEDIIVPWGYSDPDTVPWIAHRFYRPLEDVKADQKYRNTEDLQGTRRPKFAETMPSTQKDEMTKFCELFEIRDVRRREVLVICEDTLLLKAEDALQIEGVNYEFLTFNEDPEYFWGIPDVSILEPQQKELNETRTQAAKHRRVTLLKFLYQKNALTKEQLDHFLSGEVGPAVEVEAESLANAIITLQPHIPPDLRTASMEILQDMQMSMGFSENVTGAFKGGTPPSAAETVQVGQTNDARDQERRDLVHDLLVAIIRKWNQYIFSFWTTERVVKIVGPQGADMWIKYTGDELRGEYNLHVDPESGQPVTRGLRAQVMNELMKTYGGDQLVDQTALRRRHLTNFEWILPGIGSILIPTNAGMSSILSHNRQPSPMGTGQSGPAVAGMQRPGGQRGGGAQVGSPQNPIPFEQMQRRLKGE